MFTRRTFARPMAAAAVTATPALSQNRPPLSRIAFGSCANQAIGQPIWDAVLSYRPDLFLFCGDNVYGDFSSADAANLKRAYEEAGKIPGYARLRDTGHAESRCRSGTRYLPERPRRGAAAQGKRHPGSRSVAPARCRARVGRRRGRTITIPLLTRVQFIELRVIRIALQGVAAEAATRQAEPRLIDELESIHRQLDEAKMARNAR